MGVIKDILRTMDYGPSPESSEHVGVWLEEHESGFGHFINGAFTKPGDLFDVFNPASGERIARVSQGSAKDIDAAVAAARKAQAKWAALSGFERSKHLYALARHVQKRERFLSVLETIDNGKPIRESRDIDIPLVARHFYHHAGWASLIESEFPGTKPVGVCGQIIPWNFPLLMLAWKIAPALAAGNTVVLKPAEFTPLTALAFAEICVETGLPPGVVNIVTGDGATGAALVAHAGVDKIAFTGSTEVGRAIRKATAGTGKKLSLELGGKSPFIVFEDADLDSAVEGVVDAIWFNQGQVCCAGSRLLVAGRRRRRALRQAARAHGEPASRRSARQVDRRRRDRRAGAARAHPPAHAPGRGRRGSSSSAPTMSLPDRRLLLPADAGHRRRPGVRARARGDLRPGAGRDDLPHAGRSGRARQQHPLRPRGLRLDGERQSRARGRRAHQGRRRLDQFDQHVRRGRGLRRLSRKRLRPRGRPRRPVRVPDRRRAEGQAERVPCRRASTLRPASSPRAERRRRAASTAPPSSISAASRRGPIPATATRFSIRRAARSGWPGSATARTSATPSRPPRRRRPGARRRRTIARRCSITSPRILRARADEFARRLSAMTGASARAAKAEVDAVDPPRFRLCRLRRQVRRRRACDALALRHPRDERAVGRDGHRLPGRGAAARPSSRSSCRRSPWAIASSPSPRPSHPLSATDFYSVLDTSRRSRRRRQHRHRRSECPRQDARRARWRRCALVCRRRGGRGSGRGAFRRQSQGDLDLGRDGPIDWAKAEGRDSCAGRPRSRTSGRLTGNSDYQTFVTV